MGAAVTHPQAVERDALADAYARNLVAYLHDPREEYRYEAAELARKLIDLELGPDVLLEIHNRALRHRATRDVLTLKRAQELLQEALMAYAAKYYQLAEDQKQESDRLARYARVLEGVNQDMMKLNAELLERHEQLQTAHLDLQRLDQQKTDLLSTVSHEIRTPLTALLGYGEFLEEGTYGELNPAQADVVHRMIQGGRDLLQLTNNILDLSRVEAGRLVLDRQAVEIPNLAETAVEGLRPIAQKKRIDLRVELSDDLPPVFVDPQRIIQVLVNLLGNALKFTSEGGRVTLRAHPIAGQPRVRVEVEDTGIGISKEDQERIFERFRQANGGIVHRYGGTGLGLTLSRELIGLHGGDIGVDSIPGQGATFWFTLPVVEEHHPDTHV